MKVFFFFLTDSNYLLANEGRFVRMSMGEMSVPRALRRKLSSRSGVLARRRRGAPAL